MWGKIKKGIGWATKAEGLWSLGSLVSGTTAFAWLLSQWEWLAGQGWAAVTAVSIVSVSLIGIAVSGTYLAYARLRYGPIAPPSKEVAREAPAEPHESAAAAGTYDATHEKLMHFVTRYLFRACDEQQYLQVSMISFLCNVPEIATLAVAGITHQSDNSEFLEAWSSLSVLSASPPGFVPFQEMVDCVEAMERGYRRFCSRTDALAAAGKPPIVPSELFGEQWNRWRTAHNQMLAVYDEIRLNPRMGKLFRPARPNRFGTAIPEAVAQSS